MATTDTDSDLDEEVEQEMENWENLEHWASEAMKGANNWLVTIRNATDEGIKPWSDPFASRQGEKEDENKRDDDNETLGETNGILSYSEGLTAITAADEFAEKHGWRRLQGEYYAEDIKQIIGTIKEEEKEIKGILTDEGEKPGYTPAPYLPRELTDDFTDAVSFSTTVLMGALDPDEEVLQSDLVDEANIREALEKNLNWLLNNQIETRHGAGWAWVGGDSDEYEEYEETINTHNYFTYSGVIPLVDFYVGGLGDSSVPGIEKLAGKYEEEIEDAIRNAAEFLEKEYCMEDQKGNTGWKTPKGRSLNPVMSCYAILGLSYIDSKVGDSIDGVDVNTERLTQGMSYLWGYIEWAEDDELWSQKEKYTCKLGTSADESYTDGSAPYLFLDTIYEFINYGAGNMNELDVNETRLREWASDFGKKILLKCWAGDEEFSDKGFRHLGVPGNARDDPYQNPTALYTTNVAIETFLFNVLYDPEEEKTQIYEDEQVLEDTQASPKAEVEQTLEESRSKETTKKTVIINADGNVDSMSEDEYTDKIDAQLISIEETVETLIEDIDADSPSGENESKMYNKRNRQFVKELGYLMQTLRQEYEDWSSITDVLSDAHDSMTESEGDNYHEVLKKINIERFIRYIGQVYFCDSRDAYEQQGVQMDEDKKWLFVPQRKIVDDIEGWDEDQFADDEKRRTRIENKIDELIEQPWGGKSMKKSVIEFEERYEEEILED